MESLARRFEAYPLNPTDVEDQRILWECAARDLILQVTDRTGCGSGWYGHCHQVLSWFLNRRGVALDGAGPLRRVTFQADDPQDALTLTRYIDIHLTETRPNAASPGSQPVDMKAPTARAERLGRRASPTEPPSRTWAAGTSVMRWGPQRSFRGRRHPSRAARACPPTQRILA